MSKTKAELELRDLQKDHQQQLDDFAVRFDLSSSPRESFLAARNSRLGQLSSETTTYSRFLQVAQDIESLSEEKAKIQKAMDLLKSRQEALSRLSLNRTQVAMTAISDVAVALLGADLPRQKEFGEAKNVTLQFGDDVVLVDGEANFAESSNVILKNAAILALFCAATLDEKFFHPRFLLMDNVEDKGMEDERSHNFQKLIVARSEAATFEHQIIFTTSTIEPTLNVPAYTIGPFYDHDHKTLDIL